MSAQSEQAKGHAKEAAGLLTGDEDLQAEGKACEIGLVLHLGRSDPAKV